MRLRSFFGVLTSLFIALPSVHATNALYSSSYGARSGGMAGATLASGNDALSQIINPANLASVQQQLDINLTYLRSNLRFRNPLNDRENDRDFNGYPLSDNNFVIPAVGYAHALPNTNWHLGFQLYGLGGDAARFVLDDFAPPRGFGPNQKFRANLAIMSFGPAAAYRFNDRLSIGASLQITAARMILDQPFGTFAPPDSLRFRFLFDMPEYGFHYTLSTRIGATLKLNEQFTFAAAYQSPRDFNLDGDVRLSFPPGLGLDIINTQATIPLTLPHQIDTGLSFAFNTALLFEIGYSWIGWSLEDPFSTFKVQLRPAPAGFPEILAAAIDWDDQHIVRFGAEYSVSELLTIRSGYSFASNPVTSAGAFLTFPAYGFHALTAGASYQLSKKWEISLAFERSFSESVETQISSVDSFHNNSREDHNQYSAQIQFSRTFN